MASRRITNPFGDDEDDDDDFTNPFAKPKKKATPQKPAAVKAAVTTETPQKTKESSKEVADMVASPPKKKAPTKAKSAFLNPFDDDNDNDNTNNNKMSKSSSSNPFGISRTNNTTAKVTKASPSNPFGDDDYDDDDNHDDGGITKTFKKMNNNNNDSFTIPQPLVSKPLVSSAKKPNQLSANDRSKTVQTNNQSSLSAKKKANITNPFDFDADFNSNSNNSNNKYANDTTHAVSVAAKPKVVRKSFFGGNRNNASTANTITKSAETKPILPTMDQYDEASTPIKKNSIKPNITTNNTFNSTPKRNTNNASSTITSLQNVIKSSSKPSFKTTSVTPLVVTPLVTTQKSTNNKKSTTTPTTPMSPSTPMTPTTRIKKKRKKKTQFKVQCWPYDNYHQEQDKFYQQLQDQNLFGNSNNLTGNNGTVSNPSSPAPLTSPNRKKRQAKLKKKRMKKKQAELHGGYYSGSTSSDDDDDEQQPASASRRNNLKGSKSTVNGGGGGKASNGLFERPDDLPSIKETVQNLSLFDFENKAEERAVSIVSTWLFDAGLIDELLVNGGVSGGAVGGGGSLKNNNVNSSMQQYPILSSTTNLLNISAKSSEGIEVGAHGFPIEGGLKIDKEIEKLRGNAQRELTLINTRLNDGVAASGSEVQEMVNAVSQTKNELGRLRELVTYISSGYKHDGFENGFAAATSAGGTGIHENGQEGGDDEADDSGLRLSDFPRLKRAINARRNIFRCFRELEFFSQIPLTCDILREELHAGEWTDNEWNTIRNVCMEHVKLEILLVEAEAGMKTWLDDDDDLDDESSMPSIRSNRSLKRSWKGKYASAAGRHDVVDNFLSQHVKNVWELGDEIRMRILAGIGSAFTLALENPAGMVALVEAVEVYEHAAEQYRASHHKDDDDDESLNTTTKNRLHFTNMRAAALAQLYQDFELRGLGVFRDIHMQAADMAEEGDQLNSSFNAVMRAATELVTEIDVVKNQMAPCFAPHWRVEMLWSTCVAHVCSNQIIQQIGGPEGQNLPDLNVTQLLDLVAFVEFFRATIEDAFPSIGSMHAKKTYFDERPDLFAGDKREVNMENATDSLAWVNNMLWEVHRLASDEFLLRTRSQTEELISKVYNANHETYQTSEMRLITSLCEDTFSLVGVHLKTIRERLTKKSEALVMAVCLIFSQLRAKQISCREKFLKDLDTCCAAANDFQRMSEQCEDLIQDLIEQSDLPDVSVQTLEASCSALVSLYSGDAVYAAQKAHSYIFEPIWENVAPEFFGPAWESEYTHNELALKLTRTLDDFMADLETFLDEFMLKKTVNALVAASAVFYVKCLLLKAENHTSNKVAFFSENHVALERIDKDVKVMRDYFDGLAEGMPALSKVIEKEFQVLTTLQELFRIANGISDSDAGDFIVVLHKQVKDINITKHVVGDLWHLVQPTEERTVWELTESLEQTLIAVCPPDNSKIAHDRMNVPGLRLDETLAKLYIGSKRKRPVVAGAVEKMVTSMKKNWASSEDKTDQ